MFFDEFLVVKSFIQLVFVKNLLSCSLFLVCVDVMMVLDSKKNYFLHKSKIRLRLIKKLDL